MLPFLLHFPYVCLYPKLHINTIKTFLTRLIYGLKTKFNIPIALMVLDTKLKGILKEPIVLKINILKMLGEKQFQYSNTPIF